MPPGGQAGKPFCTDGEKVSRAGKGRGGGAAVAAGDVCRGLRACVRPVKRGRNARLPVGVRQVVLPGALGRVVIYGRGAHRAFAG